MALKKISGQLTWDPALGKFRGGDKFKKKRPVVLVHIVQVTAVLCQKHGNK